MNRKILGWSAYALAVATFIIVVTEWFVRAWILPNDFHYYRVDRRAFPYFKLVDNFQTGRVTIQNARRESTPRGTRKFKIAFVGDSNTFGTGAPDSHTYQEILQSMQTEWDVYNFGVPGYGLPEIEKVVEAITAEARYDIVAYNYNFNDVVVAMSGFLPLLGDAKTRLRTIYDYEGTSGKAKLFAMDHLKFLFVVPTILQAKQAVREIKPEAASKETDCYERHVASVHEDGRLKKPFSLYEKIYSDATLAREAAAYFTRMNERVSSRGGRLLVVPHYDFPIVDTSRDLGRRFLAGILEESKIETIDTWDLYREHFRECGFYRDYGHLGQQGNQYLATVLGKRMLKLDQ